MVAVAAPERWPPGVVLVLLLLLVHAELEDLDAALARVGGAALIVVLKDGVALEESAVASQDVVGADAVLLVLGESAAGAEVEARIVGRREACETERTVALGGRAHEGSAFLAHSSGKVQSAG